MNKKIRTTIFALLPYAMFVTAFWTWPGNHLGERWIETGAITVFLFLGMVDIWD